VSAFQFIVNTQQLKLRPTHLDEQFLQFSGLRSVTLGPFDCVDFLCLSLCVLCVFAAYCIGLVVLFLARWGGPDVIEA